MRASVCILSFVYKNTFTKANKTTQRQRQTQEHKAKAQANNCKQLNNKKCILSKANENLKSKVIIKLKN